MSFLHYWGGYSNGKFRPPKEGEGVIDILEGLYIFVGCLVLTAISGWSIVFCLFNSTELVLRRKDERFKEYVLGQLHGYDRWCCSEFPQVSEICNQLEAEIKNGWRTGGQDTFREHLRKKYSVNP